MSLRLFAVCTPGQEGVLARELAPLAGAADLEVVTGGVALVGTPDTLCLANLTSRVATRVLVRVGEARVRDFARLTREAARLPWDNFTAGPVRVEVTAAAHRSRLYHTGAIIERVERTVAKCVAVTDDPAAPQLTILVRADNDLLTFSVDSSGEPLYQRGYRTDVGRAPLRETLAAAVLALAEWDPTTPLVDPMCGSGTFVLEAALLALGRVPGGRRTFAFESWPGGYPARLGRLRALLAKSERAAPAAALFGSDSDATVVEAARRNAIRADLASHVDFTVAAVAAAVLPESSLPGLVVTNPPYGRRLTPGPLRRTYAALGALVRSRPGWRLAALTSDPTLPRAVGLRPLAEHALTNGGIRVRLFVMGT